VQKLQKTIRLNFNLRYIIILLYYRQKNSYVAGFVAETKMTGRFQFVQHMLLNVTPDVIGNAYSGAMIYIIYVGGK